jgi:hypothetical protein
VSWFDISGSLTNSDGTVKIKLAQHAGTPYLPGVSVVDMESGIASDKPGLAGETKERTWIVRSWKGGEGQTHWERDTRAYMDSTNVRPVNVGEGLELSSMPETTLDSTGLASFADGQVLGRGRGYLWVGLDGDAYRWDATKWSAAISTGGTTNEITSFADGQDATTMYTGHTNKTIRSWTEAPANAELASGYTYDPVLASFGGTLYALDGDDLYSVNTTTGARTQVGDPGGSGATYLAATPWAYNRMCVSDVGIIWYQRLDSGETLIHEYNAYDDTESRIGRLPDGATFPYSILHTNTFTFVAFRAASAHALSGDAYIYAFRGGQRSTIGPIRAPSGVTASKPILLAGVIGNDLIFFYDGSVWSYNLDSGGYFHYGETLSGATAPESVSTFGSDVFIAQVGGNKVELLPKGKYTTDTAYLSLGWFDLDTPVMRKTFHEVTVLADPLPANVSVQVAYALDGDTTFTTISDTWITDGETSHSFTLSTVAVPVQGYKINVRLILKTTSTSYTPTIREVMVRGRSASRVRTWALAVDVGNPARGDQMSHAKIDEINALSLGGPVTFSNPWENRSYDSPDSATCDIVSVSGAWEQKTGASFAWVRLREVSVV